MTQSVPNATDTGGAAGMVTTIGKSRGWAITFGVITVIIGVLIMVWPGPTLLFVAILFGIQLLIAGIFRLVTGLSRSGIETSSRVLYSVIGILSIIAGILCLKAPIATVGILALIIGLMWVIGGIVEIVHAFGDDVHGRGWLITSGVIGVIAGIIVLVYPGASLVTLTWLFGILLVVLGIVAVVSAIMSGRESAPATAPTTTGGAVPQS